MFTRSLFNSDSSKASRQIDPAAPQYRLGDYGYGKRRARVFQLKKNGPVHHIEEFKVSSQMRLRTHKEYFNADNSEVIGSDVQESTVYIYAQKHGLKTPEEFALGLSQHFLDSFDLAAESNVWVETEGWQRLGEIEPQGSYYAGKAHNHVFTTSASGKRHCEVVRRRGESEPLLISGISGFRIVKTAQAPFTGYVKAGQLYTEGDMPDRILCVDINARWQYSRVDGIDFSRHWWKVRDLILRTFAGDPQTGVTTTSVQYIAYEAEKAVLDAEPSICSISIELPNYPHLPFDYSHFPPFEKKENVTISSPKESPMSIGYARLDRREK